MTDKLMTVEEVAQRLSVAQPTVYEWLRLGKVPGRIKLGRCVRVSREAFEAWLKARTQQEAH